MGRGKGKGRVWSRDKNLRRDQPIDQEKQRRTLILLTRHESAFYVHRSTRPLSDVLRQKAIKKSSETGLKPGSETATEHEDRRCESPTLPRDAHLSCQVPRWKALLEFLASFLREILSTRQRE